MNFFRTWVYWFLYPIVRFAMFFAHPVFRVTGRENIPEGPYVLTCNHSGMSDPFWVIFAIRPKHLFRFLAKIEFQRVPVIRTIMKCFGVIFVNRGHHDVGAIASACGGLRDGDTIMLFPEGTRVKPGKTVPAKCGAIQIAQECGVPILPMYLTQDKKLFHPIKAVIGKPYEPIPDHQPRPREEMKVLAAALLAEIYRLGE